MKNSGIIELLHEHEELKNVNFPAGIEFSLDGDLLTVKLASACENMQTDKSAFEGWIICLKSWLPDNVIKVELGWAQPEEASNKHYNRFLFRVVQFQKMYTWFSVSKKNTEGVKIFIKEMQSHHLIINYPKDIKHGSKSERKGEDYIESLFVNSYRNLIKDRFKIETLNQQLPVGVFIDSIKRGAYFFSGQKSAIDLWGIKGGELSIFELKYKNKKVGIISEMLFYLALIRAVFMTGEIRYPTIAKEVKFRDFEKLYNNEFEKLTGYFLIDELHPFVGEEAIILINEGLRNLGNISVHKLYYKFDSVNNSLIWI
jgi:hypothetical protein